MTSGIVNFLRSEITDPNTNRNTSSWIYPSSPMIEVGTPCISMSLIGNIPFIDTISNDELITLTYQFDIIVGMHDKFNISSSTYGNTKLRDFIADKVRESFHSCDNASIHSSCLDNSLVDEMWMPLEEENLLRKSMSFDFLIHYDTS